MSISKNTGHSDELFFEGIADRLQHLASNAKHSLHIFAPYITLRGIQALLRGIESSITIKVYTTWRRRDITMGSSDPAIYPFLRSLEGEVFLIKNLHLKGMLTDFRSFMLMTANITDNGLSLNSTGNAECANYVAQILPSNLIDFHKLIGTAIPVSDDLYEQALAIDFEDTDADKGDDFCPNQQELDFLISRLPCTRTPEELIEALERLGRNQFERNEDELMNICHDAALYDLVPSKDPKENALALKHAFISQPFVASFAISLKESPRYFGETKAWIQTNCADDPTPHRRELTDRIQNLFRWFPNLYPDLYRVTRPNYSEKLEFVGKV